MGTLLSSFFFFLSEKHKSETELKTEMQAIRDNACFVCLCAHMTRKNRLKPQPLLPAGEFAMLAPLWERMIAIQPSTSTDANFLNSEGETQEEMLEN